MKLRNGLQIFGNLPSELFSSFDFSASVDRVGVWWERVRQRGQSAARAKPGLWVSVSLSLMVCCLVSSEWMPVEAGCLQYAYGGLCRADLVKSSSHQQADSPTPWKHLPERQTSLHTWYAQHTPSTWSACDLRMEESLGARGLRIWPCAVKCKWCQQVHCGIWGQLYYLEIFSGNFSQWVLSEWESKWLIKTSQ